MAEFYYTVVKEYHHRYGNEIWALLYQVEFRARREQLRRWHQEALIHHTNLVRVGRGAESTYNPKRKWNSAWKLMLGDKEWFRKNFTEVVLRCMSERITPEQLGALGGDCPIADERTPLMAGSTHVRPALEPPAPVHSHGTSSNAVVLRERPNANASGSPHAKNRQGKILCEWFNRGECGKCEHTKAGSQGPCPYDANSVHQCSLCLSRGHGAHECKLSQSTGTKRKRSSGKGGGGKSKSQKDAYGNRIS